MKSKKLFVLLALVMVSAFTTRAHAGVSEPVARFSSALDANDQGKMTAVVKETDDKMPAEIKALVDEALLKDTPPAERDSKLFIAEKMATVYKDVSGDAMPLKEVKQRTFELKLSAQTRPAPADGVYTVETLYNEAQKNFFSPNNIIIKSGETVRWVNHDTAEHILASMPFIGEGGIFSKRIAPGESWEKKFDKPGEYYYICFIHKVMYGKITVE